MADSIQRSLIDLALAAAGTKVVTRLVKIVEIHTSAGALIRFEEDGGQPQLESTPCPNAAPTKPEIDLDNEQIGDRIRFFSFLEKAILKAATNEWQGASKLAGLIGEPCDRAFYGVLNNLVERGALEGRKNGGYRLPQEGED